MMEATIQISAKSQFLERQSQPERDYYVFTYKIAITNQGKVPVKLISRHWFITDANNQVEEVEGEGVVGEQPDIAPGERYHYSSFAVLKTPVGSMHGRYRLLNKENQSSFEVDIPAFSLAVPDLLH